MYERYTKQAIQAENNSFVPSGMINVKLPAIRIIYSNAYVSLLRSLNYAPELNFSANCADIAEKQPAFCLFRKTLNDVKARSPCAAGLHLRVNVHSETQ